jgi:hypothetical protein
MWCDRCRRHAIVMYDRCLNRFVPHWMRYYAYSVRNNLCVLFMSKSLFLLAFVSLCSRIFLLRYQEGTRFNQHNVGVGGSPSWALPSILVSLLHHVVNV